MTKNLQDEEGVIKPDDSFGSNPFEKPTEVVLVADSGEPMIPSDDVGVKMSLDLSSATLLTACRSGRKYRIERVISQGGMGIVYQAFDLSFRRSVAMKILKKDVLHKSDELLRFVEEAQIASQLEHPNIVPVHELGLDEYGNVFYTMKYVKGVTLTDVLDNLRRGHPETIEHYPLARLLTIFQKACDAVAFAHSKGVVHRDLKPENIMIGDYGEVLVMDWGLAKVMASPSANSTEAVAHAALAPSEKRVETTSLGASTATSETLNGLVMGTPGYMSPEQACTGMVDARSDIYSLGSILYSLLVLRPPIDGEDLKEVIDRIARGDMVSPVTYNDPAQAALLEPHRRRPLALAHCPDGRAPPVLSDIAMKALATRPSDRYVSVKDLQLDVEAYQDGLIWHLVLDEDFSSPDWTSRWEVHGGQWEIKDGELRLYSGEPQFLLLKKPLGGDVRIEFECHQESLYLNDIACFMSSIRSENWKEIPSSGYEFKYGGYSNSMNLLSRADRRVWAQPSVSIVRGQPYRVRAERAGSRLRFIVNDEEIFRVSDADPLSGSDRTAVGIHGWMADTRYRRIRIYSLGVPWKADLLDTAERQLQKGRYVTAMDLFQEALDSFPDAQRQERARRGYQLAGDRILVKNSLPYWRQRLEEAWPGVSFNIRMDNERLTVDVSNAGIGDLEPLRGMPVTALYCSNNRITSLEPLRAMPLVMLNCGGNPLINLDPLLGMPLVTLLCEACPVQSLKSLHGMPLVMLNCGGAMLKDGLEPLRGMHLNWLSCWSAGIRELEPLRGMSLTSLYCDGNHIRSLEPLQGMPLGTLICGGNEIESLEPLRGMPLTALHCAHNRIRDLSPLSGMQLSLFSCHYNKIKSLLPLKDVALGALMCGGNRLTSLEPFVQKPPYSFYYDGDSLPESEILRACAIWNREPSCRHHIQQAEALLALRKNDLRALRGLAAEFQGHRYLYMPTFMTWEEARDCCRRLGGHLVTIASRTENNFIASMMPEGSWFWMGLKTTRNGHEWVTGEPFQFSNFVDSIREGLLGEKVFCSGAWYSEVYPGVSNCFMIEWDE